MTAARLDRLLANLGYGSRREVTQLCASGLVVFDGEQIRDASRKVPIGPDLPQRMTVVGHPVDPPAPLTLIMHKPLDVVCSHKEAGRSIYDLLPLRFRARMPGLSSIGRLDKDTTGLLLITDDGPFLHRVISPKSKVSKRYHVTLDRPLRGTEGAVFASGELMLESEDKPLLPAVFEPLGEREANLTIDEGRYHQVRRMFAAVGNHVLQLHRDQVGGLTLPRDLAPGQWRIATAEDLARIFAGS